MTDEDIGKLVFTLLETVDDLGNVPPAQLARDANILSGAALALMLIASGLSGPINDKPKVTVN